MSRRTRAVLVALVAASAVAVAGCSGMGTQAAVAAATQAAGGDSALAAGLLTATDLPLGFQPQDDGAGAAAALGCAGIDGVYLPAGASAHATASFAHSLSEAFVNETVTLRPGGAAAALARFGAAAKDCGRFTGPDGTGYTVKTVSLPRYGDASAAVTVRSGLAEGREVELAAVRVGDVVVAIAAAGAGDGDKALAQTVLDRALAKLSRAGVTAR